MRKEILLLVLLFLFKVNPSSTQSYDISIKLVNSKIGYLEPIFFQIEMINKRKRKKIKKLTPTQYSIIEIRKFKDEEWIELENLKTVHLLSHGYLPDIELKPHEKEIFLCWRSFIRRILCIKKSSIIIVKKKDFIKLEYHINLKRGEG